MGLEAVKDEILRQTKEREIALTAEARKEGARIMREAQNAADELKEKSDLNTKRMLEHIKSQELAAGELEIKKMLLEAKRQIIENVFAEARKKIEHLDDKKREYLIKRLLERAHQEIEARYFYCSHKDLKFLKPFNPEIVDMLGGFMAENEERTIRVDYSFETMLQSVQEREMQNISKILFG